MADMTTIKGRIAETIYPNGTGAITAESHQALLLEMVDNINEVKQDVLVSGQNIRPLVSGESLLGSDALAVLGTAFIYEYESEQVFAMLNGTREEVKPWVLNRATVSQVAQSISILRQNVLQAIVPVVIKTRAESAIICWEYDGLIYEIEWENDAYKVVTTPKGNEFDAEGNYPSLRVGTADTAIDLAGRGESVPASFGFRASGGKSIKDGRAYIKRIKGNSVVWNQLVSNAERVVTSNRVSVLEAGTSIIAGHKYLFLAKFTGTESRSEVSIYTRVDGVNTIICSLSNGDANPYVFFTASISATSDGTEVASNDNLWLYYYFRGTNESISNVFIHDLTQMFQAGNEPSTIEDFNARVATLGVDPYAYNEGQVIHCNTESIKSVGENAWDEEWEANVNTIISKNFNRCIGGETYHVRINNAEYDDTRFWLAVRWFDKNKNQIQEDFCNNRLVVCPSNAWYFKISTNSSTYVYGNTYNHDIMVTLVHSGWKQDTDAGYQPYWQDTLPLPIISKYFPDGMKKAGTAHDEIRFNKASGKWEYSKSKTGGGKIKSVDLGAFNWKTDGVTSSMEGVRYESLTKLDNCVPMPASVMPNILCAKYASVTANDTYRLVTGISLKSTGTLSLADTTIADVNALKASLQDVILYYESNDWEWEELDAEDQNFRDYYNVADFGTEEAIPATDAEGNIIPSAAFSADIIYQFNAVDMIREHELEITELQSIIATMQAQLTSLINGGQ